MKIAKRVLLIAVLFVLLVAGAGSIVITGENEYSLVRQFGKIDHVVAEAGISFKIPFIQSVDTLPRHDPALRSALFGRHHQRQEDHDL